MNPHRRRKGLLAAAALVATLGCAGTATERELSLDLHAHPWWEVRGSLFAIRGNTDPRELERMAADLELFIEVVRAAADFRLSPPRYAMHIYVLREPRPVLGAAGWHSTGSRRGDLILLSRYDSSVLTRTVLYHEFVHFLTFQNRRYRPLWYHEGLAELLSTVYRREELISVGHVPESRRWILSAHRRSSVRDLLGTQGYDIPDFYEMSWLLVHFLHAGRGAGDASRREQGVAFLAELAAGEAWEPAFDRSFGFSPEALDEELEAHLELLRAGYLRMIRLDARRIDVAAPAPAAEIASSEVATDLAEFLASSDQPRLALSLLESAREQHPGDARVLAGLAWIQALLGRSDAARATLARAVAAGSLAAGSERAVVDVYAARAEAELAGEGEALDPAALERARTHYRRALERDAALPAAWAELGLSYAVEGTEEPLAPGIEALERALRLRPTDVEVRLGLARLWLRSGQPEQARPHLERVLRWARLPDRREEAQALIDELPTSP